MGAWTDDIIVNDPRIDQDSPLLRAAAERVHRNESLHRHNPDGPVCIYCALVAAQALDMQHRGDQQYAMGAAVDALANEIRRIDGSHDLGAGALAEGLAPFVESLVWSETASLAAQAADLQADLADARYALGIHSGVKDGHEGIDGETIERAIKAL